MALLTHVLNGVWDFVADLDPKYHAIHGGFHKPDADRRHWLKAPVPGVWQKYGERYDLFEGVGWFAREFDVPELPAGATARLRFGAVNYLANVHLNGRLVGSHEGGYTGFVLDVTGQLRAGTNHIAVQADNRATTIKWPPCLGYFNYGGIHRTVTLEIVNGPALDDVRIQATPGDRGGCLRVEAIVSAAHGPLTVRVDCGADGSPQLRPPGVTGECRLETVPSRAIVELAVPDADSWTPLTPCLYRVTVGLHDGGGRVLDRREFCIGFRTLAMRDGHVHLNGRPYPFKGICYVYDSPEAGLVMTPEQIEADLRLMKTMGCNAVRCHYPMDTAFYDACDRLGLLVWIEPPVYCYHPGDGETGTRFADPDWLALAQQMAREMIAVARNHPSVAIYSIGNECNTAHPEAEAFFRKLAGTMRAEDPTRLLSYAALYGLVGPIAGIVDVLGINSYWGWYDRIFGGKGSIGVPPSPHLRQDASEGAARLRRTSQGSVKRELIDLAPMRTMIETVLAKHSGLALFLTEFGADSVPGSRSPGRRLWSEDYHADLLREILALARDYPRIVGTFPFCFSDYRDPSKVPNGYWNERNLKGAVSYERRPKRAFAAVQEAYSRMNPEVELNKE